MIHVVFSSSAASTINHGIKESKRIIHFKDNLSQGPIGLNIDYNLRESWLSKVILEENNLTDHEVSNSYTNFHKEVEEIKDNDNVYIWVGDNSLEQCGLMYFLSNVNKDVNIYVINVSSKTFNKGETNAFTPRGVREVSVDTVNMFFNDAKKLSKEQVNNLVERWKTLINENSTLRIFKAGEIISVGENFYDNEILHYTTEFSKDGFRKCSRVIGHIMGISEDLVSDSYLFWRIKELIKEGNLSGKGSHKAIRDLEIK